MIYFFEVFERLEAWIKDNCDTYEGTLIDKVSVFLVYVPVFLYYGISIVAWVNRNVYNTVLSIGLLAMDAVIYTLAFFVADTRSSAGHCAHRIGTRPAEEAAIVWYIFAFYFVYALKGRSTDIDRQLVKAWHVLALGILSIACCAAIWHLQMFDGYEITISALCGVCGASIWLTIAYSIADTPKSRGKVMKVLRIDESTLPTLYE